MRILNYIFLSVFLSVSISAQWLDLPTQKRPGAWAGKYNGATSYLQDPNPQLMDLNGTELIAGTADSVNNRSAETTKGQWANGGNQTIARYTSTHIFGTASFGITSTGAGDTTTNFCNLPLAQFAGISVCSGGKITIEFFARSVSAARTLVLNLGDTSLTSATLATTYGTSTHVVFNIRATPYRIASKLRIYTPQTIAIATDTIFADNFSVTQAFDGMIACIAKTTNTGTAMRLVSTRAGGSGFEIQKTAADIYQVVVNDGTASIFGASTGNISDGRSHVIIATWQRDGNQIIYEDNVSLGSGSMTTCGKVISAGLAVGAFVGGTSPFSGVIGETQIIRFTSLNPTYAASVIAAINAQKKCFASYTNGQIVGWWDFEGGSLRDKSGNNNYLTNVGGVIFTGGNR